MSQKAKQPKNTPIKVSSFWERLRGLKIEQRQTIVYAVLVVVVVPFLFLIVNNFQHRTGRFNQQPIFKSNLKLQTAELQEPLNDLASTSQELDRQMNILDTLTEGMSTSELESFLSSTSVPPELLEANPGMAPVSPMP
jgi:hypothetical protein